MAGRTQPRAGREGAGDAVCRAAGAIDDRGRRHTRRRGGVATQAHAVQRRDLRVVGGAVAEPGGHAARRRRCRCGGRQAAAGRFGVGAAHAGGQLHAIAGDRAAAVARGCRPGDGGLCVAGRGRHTGGGARRERRHGEDGAAGGQVAGAVCHMGARERERIADRERRRPREREREAARIAMDGRVGAQRAGRQRVAVVHRDIARRDQADQHRLAERQHEGVAGIERTAGIGIDPDDGRTAGNAWRRDVIDQRADAVVVAGHLVGTLDIRCREHDRIAGAVHQAQARAAAIRIGCQAQAAGAAVQCRALERASLGRGRVRWAAAAREHHLAAAGPDGQAVAQCRAGVDVAAAGRAEAAEQRRLHERDDHLPRAAARARTLRAVVRAAATAAAGRVAALCASRRVAATATA